MGKEANKRELSKKEKYMKEANNKEEYKKEEYKKEEYKKEEQKMEYRKISVCFTLIIVLLGALGLKLLPQNVPDNFNQMAIMLLLPGFVVLSGVKLSYEENWKKSDFSYMKECFEQYLVPYIIFSALGIVFSYIKGNMQGWANISKAMISEQAWSFVTFQGYGMLWIFPVLFIASLAYGWLRKSVPFWLCGLISILLCVLAYFSKNLVSLAMQGEMSVGSYFLRFSVTVWNGAAAMAWIFLGNILYIVKKKFQSQKILLGVLGLVLFVAGGFLACRYPDANLDLFMMKYENVMLTYVELILVHSGICFFGSWLGQLGAAELLGRQWKIYFLIAENLGFLGIAKVVGESVFEITDNNFATGCAKALAMTLLAVACMLVTELQIHPWIEKHKK